MKHFWQKQTVTYIAYSLLAIILAACNRPIAKFTYERLEEEAPSEVRFDNQSKEAETYEWNFGDGNFSNAVEPVHEYRSSGNFLVTLTARKGKKETTVEQRVVIDAPLECLVEVGTPYGNMLIKLHDATPGHRDNFTKLVEQGFYDSLLFHRVIEGFMIQGGDPNSRNAEPDQPLGMGGPGYQIPAEFVDSLVHIKGALAAARTGDAVNPERMSSGSQFYIVDGREVTENQLDIMEARSGKRYTKAQREAYLKYGGTPQLDHSYTVFGQVIEGLEVIDKIAQAQTGSRDRPRENITMKMTVIK